MAGANIGLSRLSRGIGEEKEIKGHRKLEVSLEPEDYYNINSKKFFLPPIQQPAWQSGNIREMMAHKTFTTRKGALLLYAEDLASAGGAADKKALEAEDTSLFSSTNELCSAILSYGAKGNESSPIFLNFVTGRNKLGASTRSVRPGFSAKRYMSNWSRSWDDSILNKLRSNGNIWDKNLFQPNAANPSIYRRINDDLSQYPSPYHVTRSMLISPGDVKQYEFYKINTNISDQELSEEAEFASDSDPSSAAKRKLADSATIAVVARDKNNKPHLLSYKDLDGEKQTAVLQKLLVQSVLNQHESIEQLFEEGMSTVSTKSESGSILHSPLILDLEQAIVDLVTSNSSQIQSGNPVFTDASYIKTSLTQKEQLEMLEPPYNSGRGQYITLPPISSPIPAIRALKKKPLGGRVVKLPALPKTSESLSSGSHFTSEDSEQWAGNTEEEDGSSNGRLGKLANHKSSSNNSLNKVSAPDFDLATKAAKSIHGSLENLAQASSERVKGGYMPKWQEKSMRSYKSSLKSSSGSVVMGPDGDMLAIGGSCVQSLASASEYGNDDVIEDDGIKKQEDSQSKSEGIPLHSEVSENKPAGTPEGHQGSSTSPQNDATESVHDAAQDKAPSDGRSLAENDAVVEDGAVAVQLEHDTVTDTDVVPAEEHPQGEITDTAADEHQEDLVSKASTSEGETKELEENEDEKCGKDAEGSNLIEEAENEQEIQMVPDQDVSIENREQDKLDVEEAEPSINVANKPDEKDGHSHDHEEIGSVVSATSVMEDIVEQALKVAEFVIQRPTSGRDLAADAKAAAGMWAEQLKDIFRENHKKLERSTSATLCRLRPLEGESNAEGVDYWALKSSNGNNQKKLRVQSAEAAISYIKNFINQKESNSLDGDEIAKFITHNDEHVDGSGDAPSEKSSKKMSAKHSSSAQSSSSGKRLPEGTSLEFDVTSYRGSKKEEVKSTTVAKEDGVKEDEDDTKAFKEAIDQIVNETGLLEKDKNSQKQKKSKKQIRSPDSDKDGQNVDERDRFIVGLPADDKALYTPPGNDQNTSANKGKPKEPKKPAGLVPKKPKTKKPVKKEKKKVEKKPKIKKKTADKDKVDDTEKKEILTPEKAVDDAPTEKKDDQSDKEEDKVKDVTSPDMMSINQSLSAMSSETPESPQFIIIHDEFSDSESDEPITTAAVEVKSVPTVDDNFSDVMSSVTEDSTSQGPQSIQSVQSISRSQAKQAKRAAEAERRKQEVERKRRKREEAKRKSLEEVERREQLKREFEEDRMRKEEEIRLRKEREIEEKQRHDAALLAKRRQSEIALEREKKQKEERQRKMEEIARKKRAEELKRKEEEERKRKEEEELRKAEQEMLDAMAEEERIEYEKKKQEEECLLREREEQERLRREEEARKAQEEAERLMLLKLKEQKELELRLQFNRMLQSESNVLAHSQEMTRAFTFSYYELLEALGIEAPEWLKNELERYEEGSPL